jgi:hypothetical protein
MSHSDRLGSSEYDRDDALPGAPEVAWDPAEPSPDAGLPGDPSVPWVDPDDEQTPVEGEQGVEERREDERQAR